MKTHPNYKPSGIEWLGEIPAHWSVVRIKDLITKIGSGVTPKGGSEVYVDKGITFLRSQNVYDDGLRIDDVSFIEEETHLKMKNSQLQPGDILINITGASIGRSCVVPPTLKEANINQHILYLRFSPKYVPYVANYFKTVSIKEYINLIQAGTSKEALNMGQALNMPLLLPPLTEQLAIASYLDAKTTAIDQKAALLDQKINLYQELRRSIINQAVTRGLNKNTPLKDSGVKYINSIPERWQIKRVKEIFEIGRGRVIGQEKLVENGKYPVYSSQTENNGCLGFIDTYDFDGDYLTWTTDGANAGTVFKRNGKFNCTNVCGSLNIKEKQSDLDYLVYALQESSKHNKRIDTNGAKIMSNEMAVIKIPFPPKSEQTEIATYLDIQTQRIDVIVANLEAQKATLTEYRKTLINDVVTGKIAV